MSDRVAGVASRANSGSRAGTAAPKKSQRGTKPLSPRKLARPNAWPGRIQRCGIGSSCDCSPEEKLAGIQHDLQRSAAHGTQNFAGVQLLAHELAHVVPQAGTA